MIIKSDLLYEYSLNKVMHPNQHIFSFYNSDKSKKLGILVCHKSEIPIRPNFDGPILAVDFWEVTDKNKGHGTKLIKFAEELSKKFGCKGYMTLKADTTYSPNNIPHTFYRKLGFSTFDKKTDKQLDKFIKNDINATKDDFPCLLMHYPPLQPNEPKYEKIIKYLKNMLRRCK